MSSDSDHPPANSHTGSTSRARDLARLLASYARDGLARVDAPAMPPSFNAVRAALEKALGVKFEGERGAAFFRSTLVQTLFYGIFSAWVLWARQSPAPGGPFNWHDAVWHLRAPVIRALFQQLSDPGRLQPLGLVEVLDWTAAALDRVDRQALFLPAARITVRTDSQYISRAFNEDWLGNWQRNGWRTSKRKPVENQDLWQDLLEETHEREITWTLGQGPLGRPHERTVRPLGGGAGGTGPERARLLGLRRQPQGRAQRARRSAARVQRHPRRVLQAPRTAPSRDGRARETHARATHRRRGDAGTAGNEHPGSAQRDPRRVPHHRPVPEPGPNVPGQPGMVAGIPHNGWDSTRTRSDPAQRTGSRKESLCETRQPPDTDESPR